MARKIFWTGILTLPFAIIQAIIACVILLWTLATAMRVGSYVSRVADVLDRFTLNHITGWNIGSAITSQYTLRMSIVVVIAASAFALSVSLCKGICENKPGHIFVYVAFGSGIAIAKMATLTKWDFLNFPEDDTVLYLGFYILYLVLLVVHIVNIQRARAQAAIQGDTLASLLMTYLLLTTYEDANQHVI